MNHASNDRQVAIFCVVTNFQRCQVLKSLLPISTGNKNMFMFISCSLLVIHYIIDVKYQVNLQIVNVIITMIIFSYNNKILSNDNNNGNKY